MPVIDYSVPCLLSSIDQRTNSASFFSVIETVDLLQGLRQQESDILTPVSMELITLWRREAHESANDFVQVVTLERPDGTRETLSHTEFTIPRTRSRTHVQLPPVTFKDPGEHRILVGLREHESVTSYPIYVTLAKLNIVVDLTDEEHALLIRPVQGQGGFQSLLRRLQRQVVGNRLVLTVADGDRLIHYVDRYGAGGFQQRMKRIVTEVKAQLTSDQV